MGLFYAVLVVLYWNASGVHVETAVFPSMAACEDYRDTLKLQPGDDRFVAECQPTPSYRT